MGVKGFPTLKIVRPGKKPGRPNVEDYQGARSAKAIVDVVKDKIPNHVKRVADKSIDEWLQEGNNTAKAILFSDKGTTSALLKALAIDFLGSVSVAQIRDKEKAAIGKFGISSYPTFVLLPGGEREGLVYNGEMTKEGLTKFLSQIAPPNPDPAPKKAKASKAASSKDSKKASRDSSSFVQASSAHAKAESSASKATQTKESLEDEPTASPNPNVVTEDSQKPIKLPDVAPALQSLDTPASLQQACLTVKSGTCILALLPAANDADAASSSESPSAKGLKSLSEIHHKHTHRGGKLFPFYAVPSTNTEGEKLRSALSLGSSTDIHIFAVNGKKAWVKRYSGSDFGRDALEDWVDAIRMGEGKKGELPKNLLVEAKAEAKETKGKKEEAPEIKFAEGGDLPLDVVLEEISDEELQRMTEAAAAAAAKDGGKAAPVHGEL